MDYLLLGVTRWRSSTTATLGILDVYWATSLLQIVPYNTKQLLYIRAHKREKRDSAFINALHKSDVN